jgi:uncharacterized protein (DUF934 family)
MRRQDNKPKSARQTSKKHTTKQKINTIAQALIRLDELVETDRSPHSVRDFIYSLAEALGARAGIDGNVHELEDIARHVLTAIDKVGPLDAFKVALDMAIEKLTEYAPAPDKDTRSDYQRTADQFAAALTHTDCPDSFRRAFEEIYGDLLTCKTDWSHPTVIRATYAAMREHLDRNNYCGNAEGIEESILRLMESLLPYEVKEHARLAGMRRVTQSAPQPQPVRDETRELAEHIAAIIASPNTPEDVVDGLIRGMHEVDTDANVHADANYVEAILRQRIKNTEGGASDEK